MQKTDGQTDLRVDWWMDWSTSLVSERAAMRHRKSERFSGRSERWRGSEEKKHGMDRLRKRLIWKLRLKGIERGFCPLGFMSPISSCFHDDSLHLPKKVKKIRAELRWKDLLRSLRNSTSFAFSWKRQNFFSLLAGQSLGFSKSVWLQEVFISVDLSREKWLPWIIDR